MRSTYQAALRQGSQAPGLVGSVVHLPTGEGRPEVKDAPRHTGVRVSARSHLPTRARFWSSFP